MHFGQTKRLARDLPALAVSDQGHQLLGNLLRLCGKGDLVSEFFGETEEHVDGLRGDGLGLVADALGREEEGHHPGQEALVVEEVVCVAHDGFEEKIGGQVVVVLQEVVLQKLLHQSTVGVFRRVPPSQLPRDALV